MDTRRLVGIVSLGILFVVVLFLISSLVAQRHEDTLTVSFLDVGQGDSIFIQSPSGKQLLIDGGPNRAVLRELGRHMSWYDRHIDVVVATHPDADHIGGLIDVLERYDVDYVYRPGVVHDTPEAQSFLRAIDEERATDILARREDVIDLGSGVYVEILFPDRDVFEIETNTGSVIVRVVYGDISFFLSGDSPQSIEEYVVSLDGTSLKSDVLKVGHHGSRTSTSATLLGFVSPKYGVLSRGCDNRYGHPHSDVLELLNRFEVEILDTCEEGTITFVSDGKTLTVK